MSEPVHQWTSDDAAAVRYCVRCVKVAPSREAAYGPYYRAEVYEPATGWVGLLAEPGVVKELVRLAAEVSRLQTEIEQWRTERNRLAAALAETTTREEAGRERVAAALRELKSVGGIPFYAYGDNEAACVMADAIRRAAAALGEEAKDGE